MEQLGNTAPMYCMRAVFILSGMSKMRGDKAPIRAFGSYTARVAFRSTFA